MHAGLLDNAGKSMKLLAVFLVTGCLVTANVYGLSQETRSRIIDIYNFTIDQYKLIVGLIDDLKDSKIDASLAEKKLLEWEERYDEKTEYIPTEAQNMCGLMNEMIDVSQELVDDYRPNYRKTKDLLDELEEVKSELMNEMTEVKYMLQ